MISNLPRPPWFFGAWLTFPDLSDGSKSRDFAHFLGLAVSDVWWIYGSWRSAPGDGSLLFLGINGGPCGDLPYQVGVPTDLSWFINSSSWPTDTKFMKQRTRKACHPPLTQPFWARSIDPGVYIFRHAGWLVHPPWICAKIRVPVVFCGASRHANKSSCICLTPDAASLYCRSARWTDLKMFAVVGFASHLQPIYL